MQLHEALALLNQPTGDTYKRKNNEEGGSRQQAAAAA
jgi:hypothetical protein